MIAELFGWSCEPHINIFYSTGYENLNLSEFVITYSGTNHAYQDLWIKVVNQSGGTLVCSTTNYTHLDMITTSEVEPKNVMTTISMHGNFMLGGNYAFRTQNLYIGDTSLSEYDLTKLKGLITS